MTRKITALLLALTLMLGGSLPSFAQSPAVSADLFGEEEKSPGSMVLHRDELLILAMDGVYAYRLGEAAPRHIVPIDMVYRMVPEGEDNTIFDVLLGEGDQLYGFQSQSGKLFPLTIEKDKLTFGMPVTIDLSAHTEEVDSEYSFINMPEQLLIHEGQLYLLFRTYGPSGPEVSLTAVDVHTGAVTEHKAPHVQRFCGYKDGLLLALLMDEAGAWTSRSDKPPTPTIASFDPKTDTFTEIGPSGIEYSGSNTGIAYDPVQDAIYLLDQGVVLRRDAAGKTEPCAYLGTSQLWGFSAGQMTMLGPEQIAVGSMEGVYIRGTDPAMLPKERITIYGSYESHVHKQAAKALGGMPINYLNTKWFASAQQIGQALVSGEDSIDLLFLPVSMIDLQAIMKKGYAADLSGSQVLQDFVSGLYPMMQEAASFEGRLLMVPVEVQASVNVLGYYPSVFKEVGIEPPETFGQLVDLIARWPEEYAEQHPDVIVMVMDEYRQYLLSWALSLYADYCGYTGQEFTFSAPLLMDMLKAALAVDTQDLDVNVDFSSPEAQNVWEEMYNKKQLLEVYSMLDLENLTGALASTPEGMRQYLSTPMVLSIEEGGPKVIGLTLTMMMVNPKSKQLDTAIRYAEEYVKALDQKTKTTLNPSLNEPIERPDFARTLKQMEDSLSNFEKAAAGAEGAEKTEMEANLAEYRKSAEIEKERMRWQVTAEAIQMYRQFLDTSYVSNYDLMMIMSQEGMQKLLMRLIEKQISPEQFASEADSMLRLVRLENQ